MHKLIKHDRYIEDLCLKLRPKYDRLIKNVPLRSKRKRLVAEIDILAFKDDYVDVYEVKCSFRKVKAKKQLRKIEKIMNRTTHVKNAFFFCGESQTTIPVENL